MPPINLQSKAPRLYADLARPYSKRREVAKHSDENPSLAIFIERLEAIFHSAVETTPEGATVMESESADLLPPKDDASPSS